MSGAARQIYRAFVGNIPWTIGNAELKAFGTKFGHVQSAVVIFDRNTGLSKGYGFINFTDKEALQQATQGGAGGHLLEGQYLNIQPNQSQPRHNSNDD